jgi:hypothetical protein
MTKRRSQGDGGLHWDESRQRWIASLTVGYTPAGKRIVKKASGKTKTEAKAKLKEIIRDYEDGLASGPANYTVADAVRALTACMVVIRTLLPTTGRYATSTSFRTWALASCGS